jgi:hypothetical protein
MTKEIVTAMMHGLSIDCDKFDLDENMNCQLHISTLSR